METKVFKVALNNGQEIPVLGLGTWAGDWGDQFGNFERAPIIRAVKDAVDIGYRHFDTASCYDTEAELGEGINAKIQEGVIKREDVFITTKIWSNCHRVDLVRADLLKSLKKLNMTYVDLYLMHFPISLKEGNEIEPIDENGKLIYSDADIRDTWTEMEKLVDEGLVKSIGVSNFDKKLIERLLASGRIIPAVNQVESHPYLTQNKLIEWMNSKGIKLVAYSPLGSPARYLEEPNGPVLLQNSLINELAKKYKKTPAQIALRFQVQRGVIVIPKTITKSRLVENIDVFDFELSQEDFEAVEGLNRNLRYETDNSYQDHPDYPFRDEY